MKPPLQKRPSSSFPFVSGGGSLLPQASGVTWNPAKLKREFGSRIAFMGGVDTQYLLPNGTPAQVRRATRHLLDGMTADGGGYILAASHTISPETPDENIFAMYEVAGITRQEIQDRAASIRAAVRPTTAGNL